MELTGKKLNCAQAAALLGSLAGRSLSERTIRNWMARGILPYTRVGPRLVVLDADDLTAWFQGHRVAGEQPTIPSMLAGGSGRMT